MSAASLKDQGNEEFKRGNYLKAAATYAKAIKEEPGNAVLYSNRCAALLKLNKVTKALADADDCIRLKPDWEKGYFRKAAVLETMEKYQEALEAYRHAYKLSPDNQEVSSKIRTLSKYIRASGKQVEGGSNGSSHTPDSEGVKVQRFLQEWLDFVKSEVKNLGADLPPVVHFLGGDSGEPYEETETHVRAESAFQSPDAMQQFCEFLRSQSAKVSAMAAVVIVSKKFIAYPQVWRKEGWPHRDADGIFVQLQSPNLHQMWFIPVKHFAPGQPKSLDMDYAILPDFVRQQL